MKNDTNNVPAASETTTANLQTPRIKSGVKAGGLLLPAVQKVRGA